MAVTPVAVTPVARGSRRPGLTAVCLVPLAVLAAGCGAAGGTITVGVPAPAIATATPSIATADAAQVGPGPIRARVSRVGYRITFRVMPNRASTANRMLVELTRGGGPVTGARVRVLAAMQTMDMGSATYRLAGSGTYATTVPAWAMPGEWALEVTVTPPGGSPIRVSFVDLLRG